MLLFSTHSSFAPPKKVRSHGARATPIASTLGIAGPARRQAHRAEKWVGPGTYEGRAHAQPKTSASQSCAYSRYSSLASPIPFSVKVELEGGPILTRLYIGCSAVGRSCNAARLQ